MAKNSSGSLTRRTVLKKSATASIGGLALLGTGTQSALAVRQPPESVETDRLLNVHGDELLSTLQSEGVISDWDSLPTDVSTDLSDLSTGGEGAVGVTGLPSGKEIRIGMQTDAGHLTVAVQPDQSRVYAVVDDGDDRLLADETGIRDFDSQDIECGCENIDCNGYDAEVCCGSSGCITECQCS